jgi:hypothetical protein
MIIRTATTRAYYPLSSERTTLIRGSGRIRYVRGFVIVNPKDLITAVCFRESFHRDLPCSSWSCRLLSRYAKELVRIG